MLNDAVLAVSDESQQVAPVVTNMTTCGSCAVGCFCSHSFIKLQVSAFA